MKKNPGRREQRMLAHSIHKPSSRHYRLPHANICTVIQGTKKEKVDDV